MLRLTKTQVSTLVAEKAPEYLGFFIDLKSENGGWLKWPPRLLAVKENLKLHKCVEHYNNQKFIDVSLYLYLMGKDGFQEWNDSFKNLSPEQEFEAFQEEAESWLELQPEEVDSLFPDWNASPEEEAKQIAAYQAFLKQNKATFSSGLPT